ncbi:MAG: hypothetical protein ACD_28C00120G0001, partial [uncultured bacterium]
ESVYQHPWQNPRTADEKDVHQPIHQENAPGKIDLLMKVDEGHFRERDEGDSHHHGHHVRDGKIAEISVVQSGNPEHHQRTGNAEGKEVFPGVIRMKALEKFKAQIHPNEQ